MWALLFKENVIVSTNPFLIFGKYSYLRPFLQKDAFIQILNWQRRKLNGWWWKLLGLSMFSSRLPTRIHLLPGLNHHPQEPVSTHQTLSLHDCCLICGCQFWLILLTKMWKLKKSGPTASESKKEGGDEFVLQDAVQIVLSMGFSYLQAMEAYNIFGDDVDSMVCYLVETSSTSRRKGKATEWMKESTISQIFPVSFL